MPAQSPLKATDITEVAAVEQCMRQEAVVAECGVPVAAEYGWAPARPRAGNSGPRAPITQSVRPTHQSQPRHRVERAQRSERSRSAQTQRRLDRQQRAQRDLRQNREAQRKTQSERLSGAEHRQEARQPLQQQVVDKHNEIQQARTRLGADDRARLHRAFDLQKARISRANFDHHVGRRVPRHVHLHRIPIAVFGFFPYYRDYSYFVVDDDICIVDPNSYVVVDVIDQGYWNAPGRPQVAGLRLNERQISLVRDSIPGDFPQADIRLRLALGAEIPADVDLHEFAPGVLDRIPELTEYRFLVSEDQIVIVDPRERTIALVIDRR